MKEVTWDDSVKKNSFTAEYKLAYGTYVPVVFKPIIIALNDNSRSE